MDIYLGLKKKKKPYEIIRTDPRGECFDIEIGENRTSFSKGVINGVGVINDFRYGTHYVLGENIGTFSLEGVSPQNYNNSEILWEAIITVSLHLVCPVKGYKRLQIDLNDRNKYSRDGFDALVSNMKSIGMYVEEYSSEFIRFSFPKNETFLDKLRGLFFGLCSL